MRAAARTLLAATLAAVLAAPAVAQPAIRDFMKTHGLGNAEVEAMTAAENALLARGDVMVGASEGWSTAAATGQTQVTFVGPREDGRPCVAFRHGITVAAASAAVTAIPVRRCQAPDGRWLIAIPE
jgi:hypothetical protein